MHFARETYDDMRGNDTDPITRANERAIEKLAEALETAYCAAIEAAAKACEDCLGFDEDDPGSSAAEAVRKLRTTSMKFTDADLLDGAERELFDGALDYIHIYRHADHFIAEGDGQQAEGATLREALTGLLPKPAPR